MNRIDMIAEAERLEAEAEVLIAAATTKAIREGRLDPRCTLLYCAGSPPLSQRAKELRAAADEMADDPVDVANPSSGHSTNAALIAAILSASATPPPAARHVAPSLATLKALRPMDAVYQPILRETISDIVARIAAA